MTLKLPTFLIIGAARSGTTTLYNGMQQHLEIYLPKHKRPEPHFFLKPDEYQKGLTYYSQKYFRAWDQEKAAGEASTSYLYHPDVPERMVAHLPQIKLIAILRHPIERAYSNYKVSVENGLETLSFADAVRQEHERITQPESEFHRIVQPFAYMERSMYYTHVMRYMRYFKRNQMLLLFFDDLQQNPDNVFNEIFGFLEVDSSFRDPMMYLAHNRSHANTLPIPAETRQYLADIFKPEMDQLKEWLQKDLPWTL